MRLLSLSPSELHSDIYTKKDKQKTSQLQLVNFFKWCIFAVEYY